MIKQIFTLILVLLTSATFAQKAFEGTVVMETTTAKTQERATVTVHIKDHDTRMDLISITPDYNSEYSIFIDDKGTDLVSQGEITSIDLNTAIPAKGTMTPLLKEGNVSKNGYNCTHYRFSDGTEITDYWITDAFGLTMSQMPSIFQRGMPKPTDGIQGLPVAIIVVDLNGQEVSTQKLISVTPGRVEESVFERR